MMSSLSSKLVTDGEMPGTVNSVSRISAGYAVNLSLGTHYIELIGLRQPLALAQFKPALAIPDILARYAANRLRVVRHLRYSLYKKKAYLLEFHAEVNGLFEGELTDVDQLIYMNKSLKASCWNRKSWCSRRPTISRNSLPTRLIFRLN